MTDHDDEQLEAAFRESLQRLGEGADVSAPVVARARASSRRRRQGRVAMTVAAASVAAIGIAGFVVSRDGSDTPADPPVADSSPSEPGQPVTEWRTEYWQGLQVDVPAEWGWGTAPMERFDGGPYLCGGPGAMVRADGSQEVNPVVTEPYVGRPIMLSDLCQGGGALRNPQAPYVWLGADLEPGSVEVGNGYTQETVEVAGTMLTVASDDAGLRGQILDSAVSGSLCPTEVKQPLEGRSEFTNEGVGELQEARVCAYAAETNELVAASPMQVDDFAQLEEALEAAPSDPRLCKSPGELVVVTGWYADPYTDDRELWLRHDRVFELACGVVDLGSNPLLRGPARVSATDEAIDTWRSGLYEASLTHFIFPVG